MNVIVIAILALAVPQRTNSQCFQCPPGCSCRMQETACSGITDIPRCLPYSPSELTISNSPYLTQIMSNAFAHKSFMNLETITVAETGLQVIEDYAFNGTNRLTKIEITNSDGPTTLTRYSLYGLDDLISFEVSGIKNLASVGYRAFSTATRLKTLKLQGNGIKAIHSQALESVYGLEYFDISSNPDLTLIPQTLLSHISTLRTISMNDCSLSTLYTDYFYASYMTNALLEFSASGNDWDCDEDMCPFVNWISAHYDFRIKTSLGYCHTPLILYGYQLQTLTNDDVCSNSKLDDNFYTYVTIAVACILMLSICASIYRRRDSFLRCCRNCNQTYTYIDDNDFDINAHDRAAVRCPNPPSYETVVGSSPPANPEEELPSYDDDIAPPDYEE